jgi:hypothetical protein
MNHGRKPYLHDSLLCQWVYRKWSGYRPIHRRYWSYVLLEKGFASFFSARHMVISARYRSSLVAHHVGKKRYKSCPWREQRQFGHGDVRQKSDIPKGTWLSLLATGHRSLRITWERRDTRAVLGASRDNSVMEMSARRATYQGVLAAGGTKR